MEHHGSHKDRFLWPSITSRSKLAAINHYHPSTLQAFSLGSFMVSGEHFFVPNQLGNHVKSVFSYRTYFLRMSKNIFLCSQNTQIGLECNFFDVSSMSIYCSSSCINPPRTKNDTRMFSVDKEYFQ